MLTDVRLSLDSAVRGAVEARYSERQHQRNWIATELALSWATAHPALADGLELTVASREEDVRKLADLEMLWEEIEEILGKIDLAFPSYLTPEERVRRWAHQAVTRLGEKKDEDDSLSLDGLSRCAASYLRTKWADSPSLEVWLIRHMIYAETFAFSREANVPIQVKSAGFWWDFTKATVKWLIGVGVALSVGESNGAGLGILTYFAWVCMIRLIAQDTAKIKMQIFKVFGNMQTAYRVALRSQTYPIEVERHLALAEGEGAVWPEGLRPIVQRGLARGTAW